MKRRSAETESDAKWVGATVVVDKPSAASRIIVFIVCAAIILSAALFGMVDAVTLGFFCVAAGVIGLLWLTDAWQTGELRHGHSLLPLPLLGLMIIGLLQLLPLRAVELPPNLLQLPLTQTLSLDAFATRLAIAQLAAMLIFFGAALTFINNPKRLQTTVTTIIIFGFILAIFGIIQSFSGESKIYWLREPVQATPFGPFINRHHFAACMEMIMGLTLGLFYVGAVKAEQRFLYLFAVVLMGVGMILTLSRGALLSFVGMLIFLTLTMLAHRQKAAPAGEEADDEQTRPPSNRWYLLGGGLALLFVIFAAVLLLGGDSPLSRTLGTASAGGAGDISSGRLEFWTNTLAMIRDYPLTGVGLDAFGTAYPRYDTMNGYYRLEQAHNDYLQVLAEAGAGGLILALAFIWLLFRGGLEIFNSTHDRYRRGVCLGALAGCLGMMIHSLVDFPLRTPSNFLLFLVLAALATNHIKHPKLYRKK